MSKVAIIYMVVCILLFFGLASGHENAHVTIYEDYGISSHIEWFSHFPHIVTITEPIYESQCPESCILANNINDIVAYHLMYVFSFMILFGFIVIMYLEDFDIKWNKKNLKKITEIESN